MLVSGRPDDLPANPYHPQFGSVINQISFRVGSLGGLRHLRATLEAEGAQSIFPVNHGIAWSVYCHDPDGNNLEFFVDTDWYFPQPFLEPLDLTRPDEVNGKETEEVCRRQPGVEPNGGWRTRFGARMHRFAPQP